MNANELSELITEFSGYETSVYWDIARRYYLCGSAILVDGRRLYFAYKYADWAVTDYPYLVAACYSVMIIKAFKEV